MTIYSILSVLHTHEPGSWWQAEQELEGLLRSLGMRPFLLKRPKIYLQQFNMSSCLVFLYKIFLVLKLLDTFFNKFAPNIQLMISSVGR